MKVFKSLLSKQKAGLALLAAVGGLVTTAMPTYAQVQLPKKAETPLKNLRRANFDFWAIPNSKYDLVKNTPTHKEYEAYAIIQANLVMDPFNSEISAEPFFGGVSDFSVVSQIDGHDLVPNQQYIWEAPGYYIPVINPPTGNNNPTIRAKRQFANTLDQTLIQTSPGWQYLNSKWNLSPSSLVVPEWMDDAIEQYQRSLNYAQPPSSWRHDFSESDKTFHWNFGKDLDDLPHETTTNVTVMGDEAAVASGDVKIKWVRPEQLVYDLEISAGEWQRNGDTETYGDWFNFWGSAASNQKLVDALTVEGCLNAVGTPIMEGVGAGAKVVVRVTLAKAASSPFVARMFGNAVTKFIGEEAATRAWANFGRKVEVRALERGTDDAVVEAAVERRVSGPGASAEEATPHTSTEPTGCFVAGTRVVMADGSTKPIEQVKVGDEVLSRDALSGKTAGKVVLNKVSHQAQDTLRLFLSDGRSVESTGNHPFFGYIPGQGKPQLSIVEAGHLPLGTSLVTRAGPAYGWQTVTLTRAEHQTKSVWVYNLEVQGFHTYFVGDNADKALWVHNDAADCLGNPNSDPNAVPESFPDPTDSTTPAPGGQGNPSTPNPRSVLGPVTDEFVKKAKAKLEYARFGTEAIDARYTTSRWVKKIDPVTGAVSYEERKFTSRTFAKAELEGGFGKEDFGISASGSPNRLHNPTNDPLPHNPARDSPVSIRGIDGSNEPLVNPARNDEIDGWAVNEGKNPDGTDWEAPASTAPIDDAEAKLIRRLEERLIEDPNLSGTFKIVVDEPGWKGPCPSCRNIMTKFKEKYGDRIDIVVYYGDRNIQVWSP